MQYICMYVDNNGAHETIEFPRIPAIAFSVLSGDACCAVCGMNDCLLSLNSSQCKYQLLRAWLSSTAQSQDGDGGHVETRV